MTRQRVDQVLDQISEIDIPQDYSAVVTAARTAIELYEGLLSSIDDREQFSPRA